MIYRKRTDPHARYVAAQCGISELMEAVGEAVFPRDLEELRVGFLQVPKATIADLFYAEDYKC